MRLDVVISLDPPLMRLAAKFSLDYETRLTVLETSVSVLSDKIAEVKVAFDAAVARNQADDAAMKARIAELEALVASGGATPEDIAALDELKAIADGLDASNPAVLPPAVAAAARHR